MGGGELFKKIKPVSTGIDLPATSSDREFKKKYDEQAMGIDTDGFTIYVSLNSSKDMDEMFYDGDTVTPPTTYFRFKIGETPTYSFYFGESAPCIPILATNVKVSRIIINKKTQKVEIQFTEGIPTMSFTKGKMNWKYADELATNGYFYQAGSDGFPSTLAGISPYNAQNAKYFRDNASELDTVVAKLRGEGQGIYLWDADSAKVMYSAQSFTFDKDLDSEFLLPAAVNFGDIDALDTKNSYISFPLPLKIRRKNQ